MKPYLIPRDQYISLRNHLSACENVLKCLELPAVYTKPDELKSFLTRSEALLHQTVKKVEMVIAE